MCFWSERVRVLVNHYALICIVCFAFSILPALLEETREGHPSVSSYCLYNLICLEMLSYGTFSDKKQ